MAGNQLSRRTLLRSGAGLAVGSATILATGVTPAGAQTDTVPTYRLDAGTCTPRGHRPSASAPNPPVQDCSSCTACRHHSDNKVFASADAAEQGRAHYACNCAVVDGPELSHAVYDALFTSNPRGSVDRRNSAVADLLDHGDAGGVPVPILAGTAPLLIAAAGGVWWWRSRAHKEPVDAAGVGQGPGSSAQ